MGDNDEKEEKTGGNALSTDQLLEYIKKQKARIKRLEKEKETLGKVNKEQELEKSNAIALQSEVKSSSNNSSSLFWGLIGRESSFQQKLAQSALNFLVKTISNSSLGKQYIPTKRSLFDKWRNGILQVKTEKIQNDLKETTKSFNILEQKTAKLKVHMRTHIQIFSYIHIHVYIHVYTFIYAYIYVYMHMCIHIYECTNLFVYINICIFI
jgi:hypothetical protein